MSTSFCSRFLELAEELTSTSSGPNLHLASLFDSEKELKLSSLLLLSCDRSLSIKSSLLSHDWFAESTSSLSSLESKISICDSTCESSSPNSELGSNCRDCSAYSSTSISLMLTVSALETSSSETSELSESSFCGLVADMFEIFLFIILIN